MPIRKIVSRSIGTDVIAAEDLAANSVTVSEIQDGAVSSAKLDTNIDIAGTLDVTGDLTADSGIKLPTASGGVYTVTGTDTATNRSLTLPNEAGTVLTSASSIPTSNLTGDIIQDAGPTFFAYKSSAQSLSTGNQKITYDTTRWNVDSAYDTSTSRFTPQVAGYYQINAGWYVVTSLETEGVVYLFMNGSNYSMVCNLIGGAGVRAFTGSQLVYMNGSTDYLEVYAYINRALTTNSGGDTATFFTGALVRKA